MNLRNLVMLTAATALLGGCVVAPHAHPPRTYQYEEPTYYDDDYRSTPSYEGYYYVRVIFIGRVPYYVDDDRHIRPIPHHLHDHFRKYPYKQHHRYPPAFSRDHEVRDGYPMSRIIYLNNVPHYVDEDRIARPLPRHQQERFRYNPPGDNGSRPMPPAFERERERQEPPANGRERERPLPPALERERQEPPAYGRERERQEPPAYGRERERQEPPAYGRERERQEPAANGRERERQGPPATGRERERQEPPVTGRERERQQPPATMTGGDRQGEDRKQGNNRQDKKKKGNNDSEENEHDSSKKNRRNND